MKIDRMTNMRTQKVRETSGSKAQHQYLIENMREGFAHCRMVFEYGLPRDFVYLNVNRAFERLTGLRNVVGKRATEAIPGIRESNPELFEVFGKVVSTGEAASFEIYLDALRRWFSVSAYRPEAGHFAAVFDDITKRRLIEIEVRALHDDLKRQAQRIAGLETANKELESFSYSVSHDLRAPLGVIDGFSRIFEQDYAGRLDAEGRRLLGVIRDTGRKMAQLIDDLLEYSLLGAKSLASGEIDMKGLFADALEGLRTAGERLDGVVLHPLPPARGDATLLKHAVTNLLANAIKFCGKRERPAIEVSGRESGTQCVYCVKDNGAGFDMKYYDQLFGVFQRLHRDDEFDGTGVGLAIVQRVVSRHGGRVWAEGKVDEGAAFFFSLPKASAI